MNGRKPGIEWTRYWLYAVAVCLIFWVLLGFGTWVLLKILL